MANKGPWGCFIHIPKTSGTWTKRVLRHIGNGERDGDTHQLPRQWIHKRYFTIVRPPVDWLRSVFGNRVQSRWQEHPSPSPWAEFCKIVVPYRTSSFEDFIESIVTKEKGIVGWLFGCYTPPQVEIVRMGEHQIRFLKKLGCHPEREMPANVSGVLPEITPRIRQAVFNAELQTYGKLGYDMSGEYLVYWS